MQRTVVIVIGKKSTEYKENLNGIENLKIVCLRRLTLRLNVTVTVTVTEEFVVRPLQLVRWRSTQSKLSCLRRSINGRKQIGLEMWLKSRRGSHNLKFGGQT